VRVEKAERQRDWRSVAVEHLEGLGRMDSLLVEMMVVGQKGLQPVVVLFVDCQKGLGLAVKSAADYQKDSRAQLLVLLQRDLVVIREFLRKDLK
jgi:long-subunit acyl-CoA synthetase (AMP-forming)